MEKLRRQVFDTIQIGNKRNLVSRIFDWVIVFSGIWWSMSTLLTVGYGDIYPITTLGKLMAIIIAFLGVGMVAIPTGIISAGNLSQPKIFLLEIT